MDLALIKILDLYDLILEKVQNNEVEVGAIVQIQKSLEQNIHKI